MWLLPLHQFIGLSKMKPHQELLREGKLARYDSSMSAIFFLSHRKYFDRANDARRTSAPRLTRFICSLSCTALPPSRTSCTEWTSFDHPDPTGEQLRCMQRQVLKMLEGSAADVKVGFTDRLHLPTGSSVSGAEWKRLLDAGNVFIWLDYSSVPVSWTAHTQLPPVASKSDHFPTNRSPSCAANRGLQQRARRRFG